MRPRVTNFACSFVLWVSTKSAQIIALGLNLALPQDSLVIRQSKMGRIMLSPVAGGRAASPILCPEHISKTMLATVMKLHGWIDLIKAEGSAQEP